MEDGGDVVADGKDAPAVGDDVDLDDGEEVDFDMDAPGEPIVNCRRKTELIRVIQMIRTCLTKN
jgi:hypothetical protein